MTFGYKILISFRAYARSVALIRPQGRVWKMCLGELSACKLERISICVFFELVFQKKNSTRFWLLSALGDGCQRSFQFLHCVSKNISNIFDCNLKKSFQILLIFGVSISDTTCHHMPVQLSTSPNVCFCTIKGMQTKRNMRWNTQKR